MNDEQVTALVKAASALTIAEQTFLQAMALMTPEEIQASKTTLRRFTDLENIILRRTGLFSELPEPNETDVADIKDKVKRYEAGLRRIIYRYEHHDVVDRGKGMYRDAALTLGLTPEGYIPPNYDDD
jgi:hypothetical protein